MCKKSDLQLSDREWECPNCGTDHDRDQNAGINLKNYGLKELGLGQPEIKPVEKKSSGFEAIQNQDFSVKQEALKSLVLG